MREFQRAPRGYELMVLINPEVTDEALTAAVDQISGYVTSNGAEITYLKRDTPWGRRRLAYPIGRFRDATYILYQFMGSPSALLDLERELKLDERIIRYLLVRQEHLHVDEDETASAEEISSGDVELESAPAVELETAPAAEPETAPAAELETAPTTEEDESDVDEEPDVAEESGEDDAEEADDTEE